jgi:hypothetical protein
VREEGKSRVEALERGLVYTCPGRAGGLTCGSSRGRGAVTSSLVLCIFSSDEAKRLGPELTSRAATSCEPALVYVKQKNTRQLVYLSLLVLRGARPRIVRYSTRQTMGRRPARSIGKFGNPSRRAVSDAILFFSFVFSPMQHTGVPLTLKFSLTPCHKNQSASAGSPVLYSVPQTPPS